MWDDLKIFNLYKTVAKALSTLMIGEAIGILFLSGGSLNSKHHSCKIFISFHRVNLVTEMYPKGVLCSKLIHRLNDHSVIYNVKVRSNLKSQSLLMVHVCHTIGRCHIFRRENALPKMAFGSKCPCNF